MATRFYIVPIIGTGQTGFPGDPRRPKYIASIAGHWHGMDYGNEPIMLVAADVTSAEHTSISANTDVISAPANLDATVGANLATAQAKLEAAAIPANWMTSGMTWRAVVKWLTRLFQLAQRHQGSFGGRWLSGITLNQTIGDLTATQKQRLIAVAQTFNVDTSGVTNATTIRAALKLLADALPAAPSLRGIAL